MIILSGDENEIFAAYKPWRTSGMPVDDYSGSFFMDSTPSMLLRASRLTINVLTSLRNWFYYRYLCQTHRQKKESSARQS
jgi:hypothetical protein